MDTKTYLNQIAVLNSVIRNKTEELQQLKGMTLSISTTQKEVNVQVRTISRGLPYRAVIQCILEIGTTR